MAGMEPAPSEAHRIAARVRAAVAYCGENLEQIGRASVGRTKLRRIASATSPRGATPLELWSIADACGVPRAWLEAGVWDDRDDQPPPQRTNPFGAGSVDDRLEIIERYLLALLRLEEARGDPLPLPEPESSPPLRTPDRQVDSAIRAAVGQARQAAGTPSETTDRT
jgi:hypothetical protein